MDGFATNEGVIIIAATNRPDILVRRFCVPEFERIYRPARYQGARAILKIHARVKCSTRTRTSGVAFRHRASARPTKICSTRPRGGDRSKKKISMDELSEAMVKVIAGRKNELFQTGRKSSPRTTKPGAQLSQVFANMPGADFNHRGMAEVLCRCKSEDKSFASKSKSRILRSCSADAWRALHNDISTGASTI